VLRNEEHVDGGGGGLQSRSQVLTRQAKPKRKNGARNQVSILIETFFRA